MSLLDRGGGRVIHKSMRDVKSMLFSDALRGVGLSKAPVIADILQW